MSGFWMRLEALIAAGELTLERPKGTAHPRYPRCVYPLDYGCLQGGVGGDGDALDVWRGSLPSGELVGAICTVRHAEARRGNKAAAGLHR